MAVADYQISDADGNYKSPNTIARCPNGDLYVIGGDTGDLAIPIQGISLKIYYSNDNGENWSLSTTLSMASEYYVGYACIAANSDNTVQVAFGSYEYIGAYDRRFHIQHLSGSHGSWGSITEIREELSWNAFSGKVMSLCIDSNDYAHIFYGSNATNIGDRYWRQIWWNGSSWSVENITATNYSKYMEGQMVCDPSDNLWAVWVIQTGAGDFRRLNKKPSGGSWSGDVACGLLTSTQNIRCAVDKDGNCGIVTRDKFRQRNADDTWEDAENMPAGASEWLTGIACDNKGVWRILTYHAVEPQLRLYERATDGTWSQIDVETTWNSATGAGASLHQAYHPSAAYMSDGFMGVAADNAVDYRYYFDYQEAKGGSRAYIFD